MRQAILNSPRYKWWVFGAIGLGSFMSVVDQTGASVALPRIADHFSSDLPTVQWVIIGYALVISVLLMPMGRLGDLISRRRVYIIGLAIFAVSAAVAASSQHIGMLIAAKAMQGAGSAMIQGNAIATVLAVFPNEERGKVLGSHLSVVGSGAVAGPALGGLLVSALGWRSVFFVSAPLAVIVILASLLILPKEDPSQAPSGERDSSFDWLGAVLSGMTLLLFLLAMTNGHRLGWTSTPIVSGGLGVVGFLAAFIWWELRAPSPMLDPHLFTQRKISLGVTARWISFMGTSSMIFLMPFFLQNIRGYSPSEAGLIVIPGAFCLAVFGIISGRLSDRFGWRRFTIVGLTMSAVALLSFATWLSETSSLLFIIPFIMLNSAGAGLFNSPNSSSILSAVERGKYGVISALTQLTRNVANVTSIAVATTIVIVTMSTLGFEPSLDAVRGAGGAEVARAFVSGMHRAYLVLGGLLLVGVVISFFNGDRARGEKAEPVAAPVVEVRTAPGESDPPG